MNQATAHPASPGIVPLPDIPKGTIARVHRIDGEHVACQRLREMGFCEEAEVKVLTNEGPIICQICGSRVGLSRQVASAVHVSPIS